MSFLKAFGSYLPSRIVRNEEIGAMVGSSAEWIYNVSGIDERRFAAEDETISDMAVSAAQDCLSNSGVASSSLGMVMVASGSSERRFPGPAASVAHRLGLESEFRRCSAQIDLGLPVVAALQSLAARVRLLDMNALVSTLALYQSNGGNLPLLLDRLAVSCRDHNQFRTYVRSATALGHVWSRRDRAWPK